MKKIKIDGIDKSILNALQNDSRITVKELSEQLDLSNTAIFERIKKMEKSGLIQNYVAILDPKILGKKLTAIFHVSLKDHSNRGLEDFVNKVTAFPEVMECYHITGDFDFMIKLITEDMDAYNTFIVEKLSLVPNLGKVNSQFALSTRKQTTAFDLS